MTSPNPRLTRFWTSLLGSVPLRPLLVIPFVVQIFTAVGLVGYLSFHNGQQAVETLARRLQQETGARVKQNLDTHFALPHQLNQLNLAAIERGELKVRDRQQAGRYFWQQAKVFGQISYIYAYLSDQSGVGAGRFLKGYDLVISDHPPHRPEEYTYATNSRGDRTQLITQADYDPVSDVSYQTAKKTGKPGWNPIYVVDSYENYVTLTATQPLYDRRGQFFGVLGIDLLMRDISRFLGQIELPPGGQILLIERDGTTIATSGTYPLLKTVDKSQVRLRIEELEDPLMREVGKGLRQQRVSWQALRQPKDWRLVAAGEPQFVSVQPWRDRYGLDWLMLVVVPESAFMARLNANRQITIWLCLVALSVASLLGLYSASWITEPIGQLVLASQAIARQDFAVSPRRSPIHEIDSLSLAFQAMAEQMQTSLRDLAQTNSELEHRVNQRTEQLQTTLDNLGKTQARMIQNDKMSALGQMVAGLAHEINNPVNFIQGNIRYVEDYTKELLTLIQLYDQYFETLPVAILEQREKIDLDFLEQDAAAALGSMKMGTKRIEKIVLSLRNFSRLDESDYKSVNLHEGLESTLLILEHRLQARPDRGAIIIDKTYGKLPMVECYPGQLNQVFMSLLSNAIEAIETQAQERAEAPHNSLSQPIGSITLGTEAIDHHGSPWVKLTIRDSGPGIPPAVAHRIFDPFFTTKPVGQGTGMGLSIAYQIITEGHGGSLDYRSPPGQGAEFVVQIPVGQARRPHTGLDVSAGSAPVESTSALLPPPA